MLYVATQNELKRCKAAMVCQCAPLVAVRVNVAYTSTKHRTPYTRLQLLGEYVPHQGHSVVFRMVPSYDR